MQLLCTMLTGSYLDTETPFLQTYSISPLLEHPANLPDVPPSTEPCWVFSRSPDQYCGSSLSHGCGLVYLLVYKHLQ